MSELYLDSYKLKDTILCECQKKPSKILIIIGPGIDEQQQRFSWKWYKEPSTRLNIVFSTWKAFQPPPPRTPQRQRQVKQTGDVTSPSCAARPRAGNSGVITTCLCARECFHNKQILPHVWSEERLVRIICLQMTESKHMTLSLV